MKKRRLISLAGCILLIFLEALPTGAVLSFASEDGEAVRKTFSYFSLTPYGYANFGPFFTAVLTVLLTLLTMISLFTDKKAVCSVRIALSCAAVVTSLLPLTLGADYFTPTSVIISVILSAVTAVNVLSKENRYEQ